MRSNSGRRTWISRPVVIVASVVILAAAGGVAAWRLTRPGTLPQASCGKADTNRLSGDTQILSAGPGALTCFSAAAHSCRPASIKVVEMGVDTGTNYVFIIEPGGTPCQVRRLSQDYSANFGGSTGPILATSCLRGAVPSKGVVLSCGGQDVLIPATVSTSSPPAATLPRASCGSAVTHKLAGDTELLRADPGALTCFSTAARGCRAASIKVVDMGVDTGTDYVFTIVPGETGCLVLEQSQDYSANFGGSTGPIIVTSCQRSAVNRKGVILRCYKLDVLIPATVTVPRG